LSSFEETPPPPPPHSSNSPITILPITNTQPSKASEHTCTCNQ
jgi:hypothetical protein